jgi:HSP20 family protein
MNQFLRNDFFDLDRFFETAYQPVLQKKSTDRQLNPSIDIFDSEDAYSLTAELPGIGKENITVSVENSTLTIIANSPQPTSDQQNSKVVRQERRYGTFRRSFNLGKDVDQTAIEASYNDGLLLLRIPKIQEATEKTRHIDIH